MINKKRIIATILFVFVSVVVLYALFWLFNNGRLKIIISDEQTATVIIEQNNIKNYYEIDGGELTLTLNSGDYLVTVLSGFSSNISSVGVGRFYSTNTINPELTPESGREFIGDNPGSCSEFINNLLITYPCFGPLRSMALHVPATDVVPSYTKTIGEFVDKRVISADTPDVGIIEGVMLVENRLEVLSRVNSDEGIVHNVYEILVSPNSIGLKFKDTVEFEYQEGVYVTSKISDGILVHDTDFTTFLVGKNYSELSILEFGYFPQNKGLVTHFDTNGTEGQTSLIVFEPDTKDFEKSIKDSNSPQVYIINKNEEIADKKFDEGIDRINFCGSSVCTLTSSGQLVIYDLELNITQTIYEVSDFSYTNEYLYIANTEGLIKIKPDELEGFISVRFGNYEFGGLSNNSKGTLLSVVSENKKHALLLDSVGPIKYIDKEIEPLFENSFINTISVFKDRVFISPELGDRVYDASTGKYEYSDDIKNAARTSILNDLNNINLEDGYTVRVNNL